MVIPPSFSFILPVLYIRQSQLGKWCSIVTTYYLSAEEKIIQLQEAKREMADAIMSGEGTSLASLTKEEPLELVR